MPDPAAPDRLALGLLRNLAPIGGWAVLKNWDHLPKVSGDIDLVVAGSHVSHLLASTREYLQARASTGSLLIMCNHIRLVPRILARMPSHGFDDSLFEVDFATSVPTRGFPAVTYERLQPFLENDALGFPRTTMSANKALQFLYKRVGWRRIQRAESLSDSSWAVLSVLLGTRTAALLRRGADRHQSAPVLLASASLLTRNLWHPSRLLERAHFRLGRLGGLSCPFDPRLGASARGSGWMHDVERRAIESGHAVWSPSPSLGSLPP